MAINKAQLETAMTACLAGKTPADEVTALARDMAPEDLDHLVPYLSQGADPFAFFEIWPHKGKKTIDGFYAMLDMCSALIHVQGQAGVDRLAWRLTSNTPNLERALVLATDERFYRDIVDRFLTGNPDAAPEAAESSQSTPKPVTKPKAIHQGDIEWELSGEGHVVAQIEGKGPKRRLRVSVHNGLSPLEDVRLYWRATDTDQPGGEPLLKPGRAWKKARLVEEAIELDGRYWPKDAAPDHAPTEETPWAATFTASYEPPAQAHQVQLMLVVPNEWSAEGEPLEFYQSGVLSGWRPGG